MKDPLSRRVQLQTGAVPEAGEHVTTVVGQDPERQDDGFFVIARRVSPDRVISTVDPEARHGYKTAAHGFHGDKGRLAVGPDSEIVVATVPDYRFTEPA